MVCNGVLNETKRLCDSILDCVGFFACDMVICLRIYSPTAGWARDDGCGWYSKAIPLKWAFHWFDWLFFGSLFIKFVLLLLLSMQRRLALKKEPKISTAAFFDVHVTVILVVLLTAGVEVRNLTRRGGLVGSILDLYVPNISSALIHNWFYKRMCVLRSHYYRMILRPEPKTLIHCLHWWPLLATTLGTVIACVSDSLWPITVVFYTLCIAYGALAVLILTFSRLIKMSEGNSERMNAVARDNSYAAAIQTCLCAFYMWYSYTSTMSALQGELRGDFMGWYANHFIICTMVNLGVILTLWKIWVHGPIVTLNKTHRASAEHTAIPRILRPEFVRQMLLKQLSRTPAPSSTIPQLQLQVSNTGCARYNRGSQRQIISQHLPRLPRPHAIHAPEHKDSMDWIEELSRSVGNINVCSRNAAAAETDANAHAHHAKVRDVVRAANHDVLAFPRGPKPLQQYHHPLRVPQWVHSFDDETPVAFLGRVRDADVDVDARAIHEPEHRDSMDWIEELSRSVGNINLRCSGNAVAAETNANAHARAHHVDADAHVDGDVDGD